MRQSGLVKEEVRLPLGQVSDETAFDASAPVADVFADSVQVGVSPFGVQITFALSDPMGRKPRVVGRTRMTPQLAVVFVHLLRRSLRTARSQGIGMDVPAEILRRAGVSDEEL